MYIWLSSYYRDGTISVMIFAVFHTFWMNDKISGTITGNKKAVPGSTAFKVLTFMRSALGNSSERACSSASTAGNTNVSVDNVLCITLRDSANRAAISA